MEFGRSSPASAVRSLPELKKEFVRLADVPAHLDIRGGCPFWNRPEWVGRIYPPGTKPADFLYYYSRLFASIELNSSHYHLPSAVQVKAWCEKTPDTFHFCPKIWQKISHDMPKEKIDPGVVATCVQSLLEFGDRLGMSFIQFPHWFTVERWPVLKNILGLFPKDFSLAIELRHKSFFENGQLLPDIFEDIVEMGQSLVVTDTVGEPEVVHASVSTPTLILRFLGTLDLMFDAKRLALWADRLKILENMGLERIYFFGHQPGDVGALDIMKIFSNETQLDGVGDYKFVFPHFEKQMPLF